MDKTIIYWSVGYLIIAVLHFVGLRYLKSKQQYKSFDFITSGLWPLSFLTILIIVIMGMFYKKKKGSVPKMRNPPPPPVKNDLGDMDSFKHVGNYADYLKNRVGAPGDYRNGTN